MARLRKRNRIEEAEIGLDYLQRIHDKHEAWIGQLDGPLVILDANRNILDDAQARGDAIQQVAEAITRVLHVS